MYAKWLANDVNSIIFHLNFWVQFNGVVNIYGRWVICTHCLAIKFNRCFHLRCIQPGTQWTYVVRWIFETRIGTCVPFKLIGFFFASMMAFIRETNHALDGRECLLCNPHSLRFICFCFTTLFGRPHRWDCVSSFCHIHDWDRRWEDAKRYRK